MAETRIADIIVPSIFNPYMIQLSTEKSAFWQSGLVQADPRVQPGSRAGGETVNMPYWLDLTGDAEELSDQKALSINSITTAQDVSVVQALGKSFGANDLAWALSGADPMATIAGHIASWWTRQMQKRLIAIVKGVVASSAFASSNVYDISGGSGTAAVIDKESFADAVAKLGDAGDELTAVAMHSAVYYKLLKDDMLDIVRGSDNANFATYQGKRVIVDDSMPLSSTVYTTMLFGPGAIAYAEGEPKVPVEFDRVALSGYDFMVSRRHFVLHPRGVKWAGSANISTGDGSSGHPTLAELYTGTNWVKVYDTKAIKMVGFKHKIA